MRGKLTPAAESPVIYLPRERFVATDASADAVFVGGDKRGSCVSVSDDTLYDLGAACLLILLINVTTLCWVLFGN